MKISVKLSLAMGLLTLIIVGSNLFSIYQLSRVNDTSSVLATDWMPAIVNIEEANTFFSDFRLAEVQHALATSEEEMAHYEKQLAEITKSFENRLKAYEALPLEPEEIGLMAEFKKLNAEYDNLHNEIRKLSRQNRTEEVVAILNGPARELYTKASAVLMEIVAINIKGGQKASETGNEIYASSSFSLMALLAISVLIAVVVSVIIIRGILTQLGKDPGILGDIAQRVTDGDYNIDDGSPKIGVYGNIVSMVSALKENILKAEQASEQAREESARATEAMQHAEASSVEIHAKSAAMLVAADKLEQVANMVSSASTELSAQIEQSERGSVEQASRVAETATAMEEMNSTVLEVARNAASASDVSARTKDKAEAGAAIVQSAVTSIRAVQEQAVRLKEDMIKLDENAKAITQIMGVISDIADQTNLLALNAAIEAARAGEAGRGFAVVADEVRKLAEKTMASTTEVGSAIRGIQQSAEQSMAQVDASSKSIEEATEYANRSGEALQEIVQLVESSADQVRAIATASEQQSASSEEINQSIMQVNTIANETARAMQEAAHAISDLAGQAQVLTRLIEDMKSA